MGALDYDASVPMDSGSPFQVEAKEYKYQDPDYVPSDRRVRILESRERRSHLSRAQEEDSSWMPKRVINENVEYRSGKEQAVIDKERRGKLDTVIQGIMETHKEAFKRYRAAKKYLLSLDEEALAAPSKKTKKAREIVDKGPPITQAEARERAWERVVRYG